jgi:hypothetical protein
LSEASLLGAKKSVEQNSTNTSSTNNSTWQHPQPKMQLPFLPVVLAIVAIDVWHLHEVSAFGILTVDTVFDRRSAIEIISASTAFVICTSINEPALAVAPFAPVDTLLPAARVKRTGVITASCASDGVAGVLHTHELAAIEDTTSLLKLVKSQGAFIVLVNLVVFHHSFPSGSGWNTQNQGPDLEKSLAILCQVVRQSLYHLFLPLVICECQEVFQTLSIDA